MLNVLSFGQSSAAGRLNSGVRPLIETMYTTEPLNDEVIITCTCCGRPIHEGSGWLLAGDDEVACYEYRWSEGHEVAFAMVLTGATDGYMRPGQVSITAWESGGEMVFSVVEPGQSVWNDSEDFGPVLSRAEALDPTGLYPDLWPLVDAIVDHEPRIAHRIKALHGA